MQDLRSRAATKELGEREEGRMEHLYEYLDGGDGLTAVGGDLTGLGGAGGGVAGQIGGLGGVEDEGPAVLELDGAARGLEGGVDEGEFDTGIGLGGAGQGRGQLGADPDDETAFLIDEGGDIGLIIGVGCGLDGDGLMSLV